MVFTRSSTTVNLVGHPKENFDGDKLPTIHEVLQVYFFHHVTEGQSQKNAITQVSDKLRRIWCQVEIPIFENKNIVRKIQMQLLVYRNTIRNAKRGNPSQLQRETVFKDAIQDLFDISRQNVMNSMKNEFLKQFLIDQQSDRKLTITSLLQTLVKGKRNCTNNENTENISSDATPTTSTAECDQTVGELIKQMSGLSSSDESFIDNDQTDDPSYSADTQENDDDKSERVKIKKAIPKTVASALDRNNISNLKAVFVLGALLADEGVEVLKKTPCSVSTIRRLRIANRKENSFMNEDYLPEGPLILHFDGKLLPTLCRSPIKEERIAILVTGDRSEKLLGVPKIPQGTGEQIANATFSLISTWNIANRIVGMSFDTTVVNTGNKKGACALLEEKLGRQLLWLPCRHHIMEVVCKYAFQAIFGKSEGPCVTMFKKFRNFWPNIDQKIFDPCADARLENELKEEKTKTIIFVQRILSHEASQLPRGDYLEMLELTLIFLGVTPPRGIHFQAPGADHHARWMSKVIYTLKLALFHRQFGLTTEQNKKCIEFGIFAAVVYVKYWMTCPRIADAPVNDLNLMKELKKYEVISMDIFRAAQTAFSRHLWYLSQELAPLSLFSDSVAISEKVKLVTKLKENAVKNYKIRSLKYSPKDNVEDKNLEDFLGPASHFLFNILDIPLSLMDAEVDTWRDSPVYLNSREKIGALKAINDSAERGVALATEFATCPRTRDEEQYQFLLQIVEKHRKDLPNSNKETLIKHYSL